MAPSKKARNMCAVLYPLEDETHAYALKYIKSNFEYACVTHDRDVEEDGSEKKSHVHVMWRFPQARYIDAVAKELTITENYIRQCGSLEKYGRYLIHADDPDKTQYEFSEVEGDLRTLIAKSFDKQKTEDEKVLSLLELLDSVPTTLTVTQFIRLACAHGLYSEVRRNGYMMSKILEEHNQEVRSNQISTT